MANYTYTDNNLRYKIHDTEATDATKDQKIYLELPDESSITISNTVSNLTVTFPAGTRMRLKSYDRKGNASPGYFDHHFMAFLLVTFYKANGTVISTIGSAKSSESCSGKNFDKYTVDYKIIERPGVWDNSKTPVAGAEDWTITNGSAVEFSNIPIPEDAAMFTIAVRGESNLTRTGASGIYIGVEPCPCKEQYGIDHSSVAVFTDITAGDVDTISILDTGKIRVTGTKAAAGTNNKVKSCILTVVCKGTNAKGETFTTPTSITLISKASAGGGSFTDSSITLPDGTTSVSASLSSQGVLGMEAGCFGEPITVTIDPPNPPTSIEYSTAKMHRPRLKDELEWSWSGASRGTKSSSTSYNAAIDSYRIFIYKGHVNDTKSNTDADKAARKGSASKAVRLYASGNDDKTEAGTHFVETDKNTKSIKFTPILVGESGGIHSSSANKFESKDICYCRVFSCAKWGNTEYFSTRSILGVATVPTNDKGEPDGNAAIDYYLVSTGADKQSECILHNAGTVWVRVPKNPPTDKTLVWKEGTVYVYHDNEWKEAEGVYVRDGGKWKEST